MTMLLISRSRRARDWRVSFAEVSCSTVFIRSRLSTSQVRGFTPLNGARWTPFIGSCKTKFCFNLYWWFLKVSIKAFSQADDVFCFYLIFRNFFIFDLHGLIWDSNSFFDEKFILFLLKSRCKNPELTKLYVVLRNFNFLYLFFFFHLLCLIFMIFKIKTLTIFTINPKEISIFLSGK